MSTDFSIPQAPNNETRAGSAPVSGGYESLDVNGTKKTYEELNAVLDNHMVPDLAKMQALLSQRGPDRIPNDFTPGENIVSVDGTRFIADGVEQEIAPNATAGGGESEANNVPFVISNQADENGEMISPLSPLALKELPQNFDFIASKTDDEKIEYIKAILIRSEDQAIAVIAPALRFCATAGSVVQAYMPLILEVKKHLCRPGRPKVNPTTGERSKTWAEVCEENFHIGVRRMQQILASLKEPKLLGNGGTVKRKPPIEPEDYRRAQQVAAPARTLAEAVVKQGMGDKFPQALEILKVVGIPVADMKLAGDRVLDDPDPSAMEELSQRINQMADTKEINAALESFFTGLAQLLMERHAYASSSTVSISVHVHRECRGRIDLGDWVEYMGGDNRLTKQTGGEKALGRMVGKDMLYRPRVRWYGGTAWTKPYSLMSDYKVRVLFDHQAREKFPEAYNSYPDYQGAPDARKPPVPDEETDCPPVPAADEAPQRVPDLATEACGGTPQEKTSPQAVADSSPRGGSVDTPAESSSAPEGSESSVTITICPPSVEPEGGEAPAVAVEPGSRQGDFTHTAEGRWEYDPMPNRRARSAGI